MSIDEALQQSAEVRLTFSKALSKLYLSEDDLELVKSTVDDDNRRVEDICRAMRDRSMSIDEALQQSAEVGLITIMTIQQRTIETYSFSVICKTWVNLYQIIIVIQGFHKLWKSWKTWKSTKKVPCMEKSWNLKKT